MRTPGMWRPPGERDAVDDLAEHARRRGRARTPVAGSVTASIESVAPSPYMVEVAAEAEAARVRELVVLRRRLCSTNDQPGGCAISATTWPSSRPITMPGVRSVTVAGGGGAASSTVQNGWSSGAASMANAFMHQYGEPAELYDSLIRRLS